MSNSKTKSIQKRTDDKVKNYDNETRNISIQQLASEKIASCKELTKSYYDMLILMEANQSKPMQIVSAVVPEKKQNILFRLLLKAPYKILRYILRKTGLMKVIEKTHLYNYLGTKGILHEFGR